MKGLVLAGGMSERIGHNKALIRAGDLTFVERAYVKLREELEEVYISIRKEQRGEFEFLKNHALLEDDLADIGPTAALLRAYRESPHSAWLVLACDFALAEKDDIEKLILISEAEPDAEVICYRNEFEILEPLFAVWRPSALMQLEKNRSMALAGPQASLKQLRVTELRSFHPDSLSNFNTLQDLLKLNKILSGRSS